MNRDFFRRGTRFVHEYGSLETANHPGDTFAIPAPRRVDQLCTPPVSVQQEGERRYWGERSPIVKPNGSFASTNGPEPERGPFATVVVPGRKR
jgi:hypothetical protein